MTGTLYIISAPSGAGKTSLVKALVTRHDQIKVSISHTTRTPRPGEVDGTHYHFVDNPTFNALIESGDLLEYAEVFGNCYGTSQTWVASTLAEGKDVILEIDWQGARQVRKVFPDALSIFILPPSKEALEERLVRRAQDNRQTIELRLKQAQQEMVHYSEYDFLIINDIFEEACKDLSSIVTSERLRLKAQESRHGKIIKELTKAS